MRKTKLSKNLAKMYAILSESYKGNWQYRWKDTPYLKNAIKSGEKESIVGHVWGIMEFWFYLRRICPNLDKLVDSTEVYEIILNHDLGETGIGDVPLYRKVHGESDNKLEERMSIKQITDKLPNIQKEILLWFDKFEKDISKIDKVEILVAKWLDNLQGNHFALTFGENLPLYSEPINKILQMRFVLYTNRLLEILQNSKQTEAINEVKLIANHHVKKIEEAGIKFDKSKLIL